jgi:hypothetical protein
MTVLSGRPMLLLRLSGKGLLILEDVQLVSTVLRFLYPHILVNESSEHKANEKKMRSLLKPVPLPVLPTQKAWSVSTLVV